MNAIYRKWACLSWLATIAVILSLNYNVALSQNNKNCTGEVNNYNGTIICEQIVNDPLDEHRVKLRTLQITDLIRTCAPSVNIRADLSGKMGGFIARRIVGAEAEGKLAYFEDGEILGRMIEQSPDNTVALYSMYLECVKPGLQRILLDKPY